MSSPALNDTTNVFYDIYSIPVSGFTIPSHFDTYTPDFQTNYKCRVVLVPNPKKGASAWTMNGKYITIGVYRDEGRAAGRQGQLLAESWTRVGNQMTFVSMIPHGLLVGDSCEFLDINVATYFTTVSSVIDEYTFTFHCYDIGSSSGGNDGSVCWPFKTINYFDDYIVFRLLPSFSLVPYSVIQQIFEETAPTVSTNINTMYNITTGTYSTVTSSKDDNFNYSLTANLNSDPNSDVTMMFGQQFDASGNPLPLTYQNSGQPVPNSNVNSPNANTQAFNMTTIDGVEVNDRVYVYDYYGLLINDQNRGPYFSTTLVYRDPDVAGDLNNFAYQENANGVALYAGFMTDEYGNMAIGVQSNNALVVKKQVLPVALDSFNKPIKSPSTIVGV